MGLQGSAVGVGGGGGGLNPRAHEGRTIGTDAPVMGAWTERSLRLLVLVLTKAGEQASPFMTLSLLQ